MPPTLKQCLIITPKSKSSTCIGYLLTKKNQFRNETATALFSSLIKNDVLLILDLSFNTIGGAFKTYSVNFADFIKKNKKLMTLDLSANKFTKEESD